MIKKISTLIIILGIFTCNYSQAQVQVGEYYGGLGQAETYTRNLANLCEKLKSGEELVVFGSSELTHRHSYMIHNFLTEKLNIKTTSYGHAGFQSLSVYLLLSANKECLTEKTKFVWLISPGWFDTNGTQVPSYVEYVKDDVIYKTLNDPNAIKMQKEFIEKNIKSFEKLTRAQEFLLNNDNFALRLYALRYGIYKEKLTNKIIKPEAEANPHAQVSVDWRAENSAALEYEKSLIGSNKFWVREEYFNKYLKNLSSGGVKYFSARAASDIKVGDELQSLKNVVKLLRDKSVKSILILQPLNSRVYNDFDVVEPIYKELNLTAKSENINVLDMSKIRNEYGLMSDGMHLGAVGWMRINKFVAEYVRP